MKRELRVGIMKVLRPEPVRRQRKLRECIQYTTQVRQTIFDALLYVLFENFNETRCGIILGFIYNKTRLRPVKCFSSCTVIRQNVVATCADRVADCMWCIYTLKILVSSFNQSIEIIQRLCINKNLNMFTKYSVARNQTSHQRKQHSLQNIFYIFALYKSKTQ